MKLGKKLEETLNSQINEEMYSSYLYLAMATHFKDERFNGFAKWMERQSKEELGHAMKIYGYLVQRNGKITLKAIKEPAFEGKTPLEVFNSTLKHEQHITKLVNDLYDLSGAEKDNATEIFMQWFVNEQVEEEATVLEIIDALKMIGDSKQALFMMDHEIGEHVE